jgi:hypothetical protein
MGFQAPVTIKRTLDRIHSREYVLPAIQREFVWKPAQICALLDSLMLKYPIGAFLFWNVTTERANDFVFYELMQRYHERHERYCKRLDIPQPRPLTAILDGQQRLTALNIGLNGTYAEKLPRKWVNSPDAYPVKELFLDLCHEAPDDERGMRYRFEFLVPERAREDNDHDTHWYRVRDVLTLSEGGLPLFEYVQESGVAEALRKRAFATLEALRRVVHDDPAIIYHEEEDQDLDRVLNIFIRVNSGGTTLSHSDLLLSIATAEWPERDAREAINSLVQELNAVSQGFNFTKDIVLKAGLVVTDAGDIRFKVTNFTQSNMTRLDHEWERIASALRLGARLLASFGFSERTLTAHSVLIPIADYLFQRGATDTYLNAAETRDDRSRVRTWVIRSLLKPGIWGSGLDTLLGALRRLTREHGTSAFPLEAIESEMTRLGKSIRFDLEEIEDLVESPYGNRRVFTLLVLLYPGTDVRNLFHIDHVYPKTMFTRKNLVSLRHADGTGVTPEWIEMVTDQSNRLANLQLLEGPINESKQGTPPLAWARGHFPNEQARGLYLAGHDLQGLTDDLLAFPSFYEERKVAMLRKLQRLLGVPAAEGSQRVEEANEVAATAGEGG